MRLDVMSALGNGIPIGKLDVLDGSCTQVQRVDNNDTFTATIRWPAPVAVRTPIRVTANDHTRTEYRVTSIEPAEGNAWATLQAAGPWLSIARGGLIRQVSGGVLVYTFMVEGTISELLRDYFVPNLAADGLDWISDTIGPIADDARCAVNFTGWNRTQLLQAIIEQTGYEPYLYQSAPGALYQIACAVRRGDDAPAFTVAGRTNLVRYASAQDDSEIVTACTPLGDVATDATERAGLSENAWTVLVIDSEWVTLLDPTGVVLPIAFDGELNGLFVELATSSTPVYREILASRVVDQAVKLSATTSLSTAGQTVRICLSANGDPIATLSNPAGVNAYGYVEATEDVADGRGERNWVQNGGFLAGNGSWTPGASGFVEAHPADDNTDVFGLMNGTFAALSTSIDVDGFPASTVVRRYDLLRVEGSVACTAPSGAGHTIKSDGTCTITGVSPLAYSLTDGQVLAMNAIDDSGAPVAMTVTVDGAHSSSATTLALKSFAGVTRQLTNGDKIQFEFGGTYTATTTQSLFDLFTNASGSPVVFTILMQIENTGFSAPDLTPAVTDLSTGDTVTLSDIAGRAWSATVMADYSAGQPSVLLDITIPPATVGGNYTAANPLTISVTKTDTVTKTLTNASVEFSEAGTATATWSGGLAHSYSTAHARWMTSGLVLIDYLTITSGAGASATSAVLTYPNRSKVYPLARFDNGSIGGDLLYCNSTVTLNGSGAGTISLLGSNSFSLPDNATIRLYRNTYGWPNDTPLTNVLRTVNGTTSASFPLLLRGTAPRTAWAVLHASLWVPVGTSYFSSKGSPNSFPVALEIKVNGVTTYTNSTTFTVPATMQTADRPAPYPFELRQSFPVTASCTVTFKVTAADCAHTLALIGLYLHSAQVTITDGTADPLCPFTHTSHASKPWQRANRRLIKADMAAAPIRGTIIDLSQVPNAQLVVQSIALGQEVYIRDADARQRAMQITRDPQFPAKLDIDFDRDRPFFEQLVVS